MQKIKDVLRLHQLGGVGSCRQLARAVGCEVGGGGPFTPSEGREFERLGGRSRAG
jgi:hypothetical protein